MRSFSETMVLLASGLAAAMSLGNVPGAGLPALLAVVTQWREGRRGSDDLDSQFGAAVKQLQAELSQSQEFGGLDWKVVEAAFAQLGKVDLSSDDIVTAISADNSKDEAEVVSNYVANQIDWAGHDDRYQRGFKFAFKSAYAQILATPEFKQDRVYVFVKELLASQSKNQLEQSRQHRQVIQRLNELLDRRESLDLDRKYDWSVGDKTDYLAMTFSARGTEFVGREQERQRLRALLDDKRKIVWWQIAGKAGQGKSRLALDFVDSLDDGGWHAGFLSWDQLSGVDWKSIDFLRSTLIVIDYIANPQKAQAFVQALRSLKTREHKSLHHKVRFLLLEREAYNLRGDNNGLANWLGSLLKKSDDEQALKQYSFNKQALELADLSAADMEAIINSWRKYQEKTALSADELNKVIQQLRGGSARTRAWRPLFAILFASFGAAGLEAETPLPIEDILAKALDEEQANFWNIDGEPLKQAVNLACLVTMLGQIDLKKLRELDVNKELYFDDTQQDEIIRQAHCLLGRALEPTADQPNYILQAREPDLLGEYLVIRYLGRLLNSLGDRGEQLASIVQDAWRYDFQPEHGIKILLFPTFLQRLNQDFNAHTVTERIGATLPMEKELALVKQLGELAWVACGLSEVIRQHGSVEQSAKDRLLVLAAEVGNMAIVKLALERGAAVNSIDAVTKAFPLLLAANNGHTEVIKLLLDRGAKPDQVNEKDGAFPLLLAAENGHEEVISLLLERKASPTQVNTRDDTYPLLLASQNGHIASVRTLLKWGAHPGQVIDRGGEFPLLTAAYQGHTEIVELLLEQGASPDQISDKKGDFALLVAAQNGHAEIVSLLLKKGALPTREHKDTGAFPLFFAAQNNHVKVASLLLDQEEMLPDQSNERIGSFALLVAADKGHKDIVSMLLERDASFEQTHTQNGQFPLLMAAENGHQDIVKLLLDQGANPDQINEHNCTFPLLMAAQNGHTKVVRLLLECKTTPDQMYETDGRSPLLLAAHQGHVEVVRLLLKYGADPDQATTNSDYFPLLQAAQQGHTEIAKLLLDQGAKPDRISINTGSFPLLIATHQGHTEIVRLLLDQGVNSGQVDEKYGTFPLLIAAQNGYTLIVKQLLERKASTDQVNNKDGVFPLLLAAQNGHVEVVKLLLKRGAKSGQVNINDGGFPLLVAAEKGHVGAVKLLLERGATPNQVNKKRGLFPLLQAAQNGHADVVRLLLERGAPPNQANKKRGLFPLLQAAKNGHVDSVRLLLRRGAAPNKVYGRTGESPLALALQYGHTEVARLLILAGSDVTPKMLADYRGNAAIVELLRKSKNKPGSKPLKT